VLSNTSGGWATVLSGADGSVTLTALTATRMTGTFNVVVSALTGTATGTRTVTNGEFNLQLRATGTIGPLPANAGSKVTATIAGTAWNAATISGNLTSTFGIFALAASTNTRGLSISLGEVTAPGTYALAGGSPTRQIGVTNVNNPLGNSWSSLGPGSSGSVTITSITTARITGTFSATLGPAPGTSTTGTLSVTSGTFDIGRITATIAAGATAQR
jgi:hypothetical protein